MKLGNFTFKFNFRKYFKVLVQKGLKAIDNTKIRICSYRSAVSGEIVNGMVKVLAVVFYCPHYRSLNMGKYFI